MVLQESSSMLFLLLGPSDRLILPGPRENIDKQPPLSSLDAGEAHGRRRRDLCSVYVCLTSSHFVIVILSFWTRSLVALTPLLPWIRSSSPSPLQSGLPPPLLLLSPSLLTPPLSSPPPLTLHSSSPLSSPPTLSVKSKESDLLSMRMGSPDLSSPHPQIIHIHRHSKFSHLLIYTNAQTNRT
ncbi:unnamed protein product [Brassica napus]|uniref:(rape) hypothetical protein n=1 Tax=Brassica napus TaxID=3708 RepID=A0A816KVL1_BRANA|nr:unnamed protein product [Brassica napus]